MTNIPVVRACPKDEKGCEELQVIDCNNAKVNEVLVIKIDEGNNIIQEDEGCVAITGDVEHFLKVAEKIKLEALL